MRKLLYILCVFSVLVIPAIAEDDSTTLSEDKRVGGPSEETDGVNEELQKELDELELPELYSEEDSDDSYVEIEACEKGMSFGDLKTKTHLSGTYVILNERETYDDGVFVTAAVVEIPGVVNGDLIVFAAEVIINGAVNGNVMIGAASVEINGAINGDCMLFASAAKLNGAFNGEVTVSSGAAHLNGCFNNNVESNAAVTFGRGLFLGDLSTESGNIYITDGAIINGDLHYSGLLDVDENVMIGGDTIEIVEVVENEIEEPMVKSIAKEIGMWLGWRAFWFISFLFAAFIIFLIRPTLITTVSDKMRTKPWQSPLVGFAAWMILPLIVLLLILSVVGIPFGFHLTLGLILISFVSYLWVGNFLGELILKRFYKEKPYPRLFATVIGILILVILGGIPILEYGIRFGSFAFGWGALILYVIEGIRNRKNAG